MKAVLGIDTSCYTTSCALVDLNGQVIASKRAMLPVEQGELGLRQSEAVFLHIKQFSSVFKELEPFLKEYSLCAVCASERPSDPEASYMPVFKVGVSHAETIAGACSIPCFHTTHQRGHFAAAQVGNDFLESPYFAVHLSGGTTDFILFRDDEKLVRFAFSSDIHAGQLVDRIGVMLGLPFPSGAHLEKIAGTIKATGRYKVFAQKSQCSFSGVEAAAKRDFERNPDSGAQIAAEVYDAIARTVWSVLKQNATANERVLITGGVASSLRLREQLIRLASLDECKMALYFAKPEFAGDNAVGVARIGLQKFKEGA